MALSKFSTRIQRARFGVTGYSPEQMMEIGQALTDDVRARIQRAEDVQDNPAPPLMRPLRDITTSRNVITVRGQRLHQLPGKQYVGYAQAKIRHGREPKRDWTFTGRTLRGLRVLSAGQNKAVIGFSDPVAAQRAAIQNRKWRQFGISPKNRQALLRVLNQMQFVKVQKVA